MNKIHSLIFVNLLHVTFILSLVLCTLISPIPECQANELHPQEHLQRLADIKPGERNAPERNYQNLLPQTEVRDLREQSAERRNGFDDESRSFSEESKFRNFASMTDLVKAIPEYVDVPNAVRAILSTAKLSVRMRKDSQGWRPVRIDGDPYLRAIFFESWLYLSKQSEFRRILDKIEYSSIRFEVNLTVLSSLALDDKPQSRIQGNFIALDMQVKRSTAQEWKLLAAWQTAGVAAFGLDVIGLAVYAYEAYKNRNREDPILLRLQQSPAYKAAIRD